MRTFRRDLVLLAAGLLTLAVGLVVAAVVSQPIGYVIALCGLAWTLVTMLRFTT